MWWNDVKDRSPSSANCPATYVPYLLLSVRKQKGRAVFLCAAAVEITLYQELGLTHDFQVDRIAGTLAFRIGCQTGELASRIPGDTLKYQRMVAQDHTSTHIVVHFFSLEVEIRIESS